MTLVKINHTTMVSEIAQDEVAPMQGEESTLMSTSDKLDQEIGAKVMRAMHNTLEQAGAHKFTEVAKVAVACMALNYGTPGVTVAEAKELCTVFYCHWLVLTGMKRSVVRQRNSEKKDETPCKMDDKEFVLTNKEVEEMLNPFIESHIGAFEKALPDSFVGYGRINKSWCIMLCDASDVGIRIINLTRLYALVVSFHIKGGGNVNVPDKPHFVPDDNLTPEERFNLAASEIRGDYSDEQTMFVKRFPEMVSYAASVSLQIHNFIHSSGPSGFARGWDLEDVKKQLQEECPVLEGSNSG